MPTALILGASRGIGRALVQHYLQQGWRVLASARKDGDLRSLQAAGASVLPLDVCNLEQCAALGWRLDDEKLDVAILNAGIYGPHNYDLGSPLETDFDAVMHTNVLAAMRLLPMLAPLVGNAKGRLAVVSSIMGSLGARSSNSGWLYRASKAALNSVLLDVAQDHEQHGALCVSLHPGWVKTDMGGPDADLTVEQSASGITSTLAGLQPADNGSFFTWDGKRLPW